MLIGPEKGFRLQEFEVLPAENIVVGPAGRRILRPLSMRLLVRLATRAGQFVARDELLAWFEGTAGEDSSQLTSAIEELQACLCDGSSQLIEMDEEGRFRLVGPVTSVEDYVFETDTGTIHVQPLEGSETGEFLLQTTSGPVVLQPLIEGDRGGLFNWFAELKRRRVFRAVAAYAVVAWLILQIVDVLSGAIPVPDWTLLATAFTLATGFPIAAIFSWVFQLTPVGVIAHESERRSEVTVDRSRLIHHIDLVIIAILLMVVAFLTWGSVFPVLEEDEYVAVAVMPFENLDSDSDSGYLGAGISDDIRARLHDVPQLRIAARSSSISLAGQGFDIKAIGNRLGVAHVLEGTYRRVDNRIRLNVQLVDVESGFNQWTKTYDTTVDNVLDVQNKISLFVTSELRVVLTRQLRAVLAENATEDSVAFDLYLRARNYLDRPRSDENLQMATVLFREAATQDPRFSLAYAGLCQSFIARFQHTGDTSYVDEAQANCQQALELDARLGEVHTAMGEMYLVTGELDQAEFAFGNAIELDSRAVDAFAGLGSVYARRGEPVEAEFEYRKAIDILPGNWDGYNRYAAFLFQLGRYDEALSNYEEAVRLAPNNANGFNNLGVVHYVLGDFEAAADSYRQSLELAPGRAAFSNTGSMYYFAGNFAEAAGMFERAIDVSDTDYRLWGNLADAQRFDGTEDEGRASYLRAVELATLQLEVNRNDADTLTNLAWYHANLGDRDAALEALDAAQAIGMNDPGQAYMVALTFVLLDDLEGAAQSLDRARALGFPKAILDATPEFINTDILSD